MYEYILMSEESYELYTYNDRLIQNGSYQISKCVSINLTNS